MNGKRGEPARHAGNDAEGNAGLRERQRLLAAAPEDEGIAALEPQHALALAGKLDQPLADVLLHGRGLAAALSGIFEQGAFAGEGKDGRVDQRVVDDDVGRASAFKAWIVRRPGSPGPAPTSQTVPGAKRGEAGDRAVMRISGLWPATPRWLLEFMRTL